MKITVLGWYGTETLGDRAILDGLFHIFAAVYGKGNVRVSLGSLYPFFTERTLLEDREVYARSLGSGDIRIFDSVNACRGCVDGADLVVMGGGPLYDNIGATAVVKNAFIRAKRRGIRTALLGCGLGALKDPYYVNAVGQIVRHADVVVWRDNLSGDNAQALFGNRYTVIADPAAVSALAYRDKHPKRDGGYAAVNFRELTSVYGAQSQRWMAALRGLLVELSGQYRDLRLVPMHTFGIGGDDRAMFASLMLPLDLPGAQVLHKPLSLHELYRTYRDASGCVGMRYHAVMLQTLLNGNNYILDYTEPETGKISGFLRMIGGAEHYRSRYGNLLTDQPDAAACRAALRTGTAFETNAFENTTALYKEALR